MSIKITKFADIPRFTDVGHYAVDYPLPNLIHFLDTEIKYQGLQMNPDFQRGHVWTKTQQVEYIKFLLRGGTTGRDVYFNNPSWHRPVKPGEYNDYVCVDGLQRITAIRAFVENKIRVFGSYYREYTDSLRIIQDTIRFHVNDLKTYEEVLTWYIEMNSGGTPHKKTEIRRVQLMLDNIQNPDKHRAVSALEIPKAGD